MLDRALSEPLLVGYIARASQSNWRAAAWMLERRYPGRWGEGARVIVPEAGEDNPLFAEIDDLADARRRRQLRDDFT